MIAEQELARDMDGATGEYMWDGHQTGLSFEIWAYDNGGETADRYSVVVCQEPPWLDENAEPDWWGLTMSGAPFWPQGVCMSTDGGVCDTDVRIPFDSLPPDCQRAVWQHAGWGWIFPDGVLRHYAGDGRWERS